MKIKNKYLRYFIILLSLAIIIGSGFIPRPAGMTQSMMNVLGIFLGCLILWLTVSIDWPSILCIFALGFVPELGGFGAIFQSIFADEATTILFLIGTFICTYAISKTPLLKRIALFFVSSRFAKRGPWSFIISFCLATLILGCFISPTILFVVMLPILEEILKAAKIEKGEKVGATLMMGLAFTVSISCGMTPISHVFCVLACNVAGLNIDYVKYMLIAIPVGLWIVALMLLMFRFVLRPDCSKLKNIDVSSLKAELPKIQATEILNLIIFCSIVLMWILPSLISTPAIMIAILFAIMALFIIGGFNCGMRSILGIREEKMAIPSSIFSIFSITIYVISIIYVVMDKRPIALAIMLLMILIMLISIFVSLITNAKKPRREKNLCSISAFVVVCVGLIMLFVMELVYKYLSVEAVYNVLNAIPNYTKAMPPLIGVILLSLITVHEEPLVSLPDAFKNGIPWSSIIMCGGALALGNALTSSELGLKTFLEVTLKGIMPKETILLILVFAVWALLQTNFSSNMVTATLVSAVASSVLITTNVNMTIMIYLIGMLSSFAFATPPSTPHIALAGGSGYAKTEQVFVYGSILMLLALLVTVGIGYPLGMLIMK